MTADDATLALTLIAGGQSFALPVSVARDVFRPGPVTPVPLAPRGVAGVLNLRGRVVTAIDLRAVLGLAPAVPGIAVVLEAQGERHALLADAAGDLVRLDPAGAQPVPPTAPPDLLRVTGGLYRTPGGVLTLLDPARLLAACADAPAEAAR